MARHSSLIFKSSGQDEHSNFILTYFRGDGHTSIILTYNWGGGRIYQFDFYMGGRTYKFYIFIKFATDRMEKLPIEVGAHLKRI